MAAYRQVDILVTCGLTACTPGSGPTYGDEYWRILPFTITTGPGTDSVVPGNMKSLNWSGSFLWIVLTGYRCAVDFYP